MFSSLAKQNIQPARSIIRRLLNKHAKQTYQISPFVLVNQQPNISMISLNRPEVANILNLEMIRMLSQELKRCEKTNSLFVVTGTANNFCAGGDVRVVVKSGPTKESKSFFKEEFSLDYLIKRCKCPYIALIDGITFGGGVGLAVHGKYSIATERTVMSMPEVSIGLFPDVGATYFLPRLKGKLGYYLGMTGHRLKGADVVKAGLATHFCNSKKLSHLKSALISDPSNVPNILNSFTTQPVGPFELTPYMDRINKYFRASSVERIFQNLENDGSAWSLLTLCKLSRMSPLSLKLTLRSLNKGMKMTLPECLAMEYRMVVRCLEHSDFQEGVRAMLIDKDKQPKWNPSILMDVSDDRVESFFEKLPDAEELHL